MRASPAPAEFSPVPARTLAHVFLRSLFLQATWNRRGMQNLGFAYAIAPALRTIYPDPARREEALHRHMGFFNCHPYMAAAILGGAIHHEERVAAGLEPERAPQDYKLTLQGPLAAIGDGFFWTALRPFFGALGAVGALVLGLGAIWAVVIVYNAIHLSLRIALFRAGYTRGDELVPLLARLTLPVVADRLRTAGAGLAGVAAGIFVLRGALSLGPWAGGLAALLAVLGYAALSRGARLVTTVYLAAAAGTGTAVLLAHLPGGR